LRPLCRLAHGAPSLDGMPQPARSHATCSAGAHALSGAVAAELVRHGAPPPRRLPGLAAAPLVVAGLVAVALLLTNLAAAFRPLLAAVLR
jgi:hypothetical protein